MANAHDLPVIDKANIVAKAAVELERRELDPSGYRAEVLDDGAVFAVIFVDKSAGGSDVLGSVGDLPTVEVEIDKATLEVKRSYLAR